MFQTGRAHYNIAEEKFGELELFVECQLLQVRRSSVRVHDTANTSLGFVVLDSEIAVPSLLLDESVVHCVYSKSNVEDI